MLTNLLEMDAVRVFAAIVEAGSFQAAGRLLGLPRSTISHRLAALETTLGVQLLARTTRTVTMTEAGRDYYQRVRPALQLLADANQRMAGLTEVPRGTLRVTASPGMASMWLTAVAERLLTRHPEVKLQVTLTDRFVDLVAEGFDAALRGGELEDSSLVARTLLTSQTCCFASPDYLRNRPPLRTPLDLVQHEVVLYQGEPVKQWHFNKPERLSVTVHSRYAVNHYLLHVEAAERGLGVIRVFDFIVAEAVAAGRLVPVLEGWSGKPGKLHIVTRTTAHRTAALVAFLGVVDEVITPS